MFRVFAWFVVLLVLAGVALRDQSSEPVAVCTEVRGGQTMTVAGAGWAQKAGETLRQVAALGDDVVTAETFDEYRSRLYRNVLRLWLASFFDAANGRKVDPQIIELRREQEQVEAEAAQKCATDAAALTECVPGGDAGQEPFDPKTASISLSRSATFSAEQRSIAATAIKVGRQQGIPERGWVVALAAGMQESRLRNLSYGHSSSVGVWQLIDTHGTVEQRRDVAWSARWFYRQLKAVPNWQGLSINDAAQAVERSGHPTLYAQWEDEARQLVSDLGDLDATQPDEPGVPESGEAPEVQCVAPDGSPENPDGTVTMVGVDGMAKVKDPSSGITYNIPMPKDAARQKAMRFAFAQLGEPYVFASQGPDSWDCSSVTSAAWRATGHRITPQTESMVREIPHVSKAQPGDLLYHFGHVQMFLGDIGGKEIILEAPRTGLKVRIVEQWGTTTAILDVTKMGERA